MKEPGHEVSPGKERLHYLDWLRVLAVVGVFYAHATDIFDMFHWHIRNNAQNVGLIDLAVFGTQWGMALFFFLAGASAWFALASKKKGQFLRERFKRLIIPCIVGIILLSPPQAYLLAISQSLFHGSFFQFYVFFFTNIHLSSNPQWIGAYGFHLWFLAFLFCISLVSLPVLLFFRHERGEHFISRLATLSEKPAGLFVFVLPIACIQIVLRVPFPGYQNWADFCIWLFIYLYGAMLVAHPRFTSAVQKQWKLALLVGIVSLLLLLGAYARGMVGTVGNSSHYTVEYVLYQLLLSIITWSWMIAVLYFGMRCLNVSNKVIVYSNEAVLPFYVVHYPVIMVMTFLTFAWNIPLGIHFLLDTTMALLATLVIYDLCIRRINVSRWLFGMKPLRKPQPENRHNPPSRPLSLPPAKVWQKQRVER